MADQELLILGALEDLLCEVQESALAVSSLAYALAQPGVELDLTNSRVSSEN